MTKTRQTVSLRQVKSAIRRPKDQQMTLNGLGLTRMGRVRTLQDTPAVRGMINKVIHLVEIIES